MSNTSIDKEDGYFLSRKNLDAIKKIKVKNKSEVKISNLSDSDKFIDPKKTLNTVKKISSTVEDNLESNQFGWTKKNKYVKNEIYGTCERSYLDRFFALKLKDLLPLMII